MAIAKNTFAMEFTNFFQKRSIIYTKQKIPKYFYPNQNFLIRSMLYRRKINMNTFLVVCGSVRSGKSYFALKIAELYEKVLGRKFNVIEQCSFDILPFLRWSKEAKGSIFILDECSVNLSNLDWFTVQSKIMRSFVHAQGFRGNVLVMVLPNVSHLVKSIRLMSNYVIETIRQGFVKVYRLNMKHSFGKGYLETLGTIQFSLPTKKTVDEYEKMKQEWNDSNLISDIDAIENLDTPTQKEVNLQEYYRLRNEKLRLDIDMMKEIGTKPIQLISNRKRTEEEELIL